MRRGLTTLSIALALAAPVLADAAQVTNLIGDKDGFGLGLQPGDIALPADATWAWDGWDGPGDGDGTDKWFFGPQSFVFNFTLPAPPVDGAHLEVMTWGQGYDPGNVSVGRPTRVYLNDVFIGNLTIGDIYAPPAGNNIVRKDIFDLGPYLGALTGHDTVRFQNFCSCDGWALDYAELSLQTASVSEPGTLALFGVVLAGLGVVRQRTPIRRSAY